MLQRPNAAVGKSSAFAFRLHFNDVLTWLERDALEIADTDAVGALCAHGLAVNAERHGAAVAEHLDVCCLACAFRVASACDVDHRLRVPVGLIEEEGILSHFAVVRHQSLVVDARSVALCSVGRSEVKHVPHESSPYEGAFADDFPVADVVFRLPVFWVPPACWVGLYERVLLMIDARSSTIFADTDAEVGAALVGVIEERS